MKRKWNIILLAVALLAFFFVVYNGIQQGSASNSRSDTIVYFLLEHVVPQGCGGYYTWNVIVRKSAHVTEYALFSGCLLAFLLACRFCWWKAVVCTCAAGVLLGLADELYQGTINRTGQLADALGYDQIGTLLGMGIVLWLWWRKKRRPTQ